MKTILFIDGQNLKGKIQEVFSFAKLPDPDWGSYDYSGLFHQVLNGIQVDGRYFYSAKIGEHEKTVRKSRELIEAQRILKTHLESQGYKFIISGRVRGQLSKDEKGKERLVFKEKGVDVRIAVDLVSMACDKIIQQAIIASSDSDLQPAIKELRKRNIPTIYLGFERNVNKGLTFTTGRTILIRDAEVMKFQGAGTLLLPEVK